jgi:FixJ family two-component response regulator
MDQRTSASCALVLLVDDDEAVRRGLEFTLDLAGYRVATFCTGEALLAHDLPPGPVCLVLDERLPGLSGLDTLRAVHERRPETPALLITTHPPAALRRAAATASVPILEKPLNGDDLVEAIAVELGRAN